MRNPFSGSQTLSPATVPENKNNQSKIIKIEQIDLNSDHSEGSNKKAV